MMKQTLSANACSLRRRGVRLLASVMFVVVASQSGAVYAQGYESLREVIGIARTMQMEKHGWLAEQVVELIPRVQAALVSEPDDAMRAKGYYLLGDLFFSSNDATAALDAYTRALALPLSPQAIRIQTIRRQRDSYMRLGQEEKAFAVAKRVIEENKQAMGKPGMAGAMASSMWSSDMKWLGSYYERRKDWLAAVEVSEAIMAHYEDPALHWGFLQHQGRLLLHAGKKAEAYQRFAEAYASLKLHTNLPKDWKFLATEIEMLRLGVHHDVKSRQYFADVTEILRRYADTCGYGTLIHEYNIATGTLHLRDASEDEQVEAIVMIGDVIDRAERAWREGEETPIFDRVSLRSAYFTVISDSIFKLGRRLCCDERVLDRLRGYLEAFADDPETVGWVRRKLEAIEERIDPALWADYPVLDELRPLRESEVAQGVQTPDDVGERIQPMPTSPTPASAEKQDKRTSPSERRTETADSAPTKMVSEQPQAPKKKAQPKPESPVESSKPTAIAERRAAPKRTPLASISQVESGKPASGKPASGPQSVEHAKAAAESPTVSEPLRVRKGTENVPPSTRRKPAAPEDAKAPVVVATTRPAEDGERQSHVWHYAGGAAFVAAALGAMLLWKGRVR